LGDDPDQEIIRMIASGFAGIWPGAAACARATEAGRPSIQAPPNAISELFRNRRRLIPSTSLADRGEG
jgi:hypothetical protein